MHAMSPLTAGVLGAMVGFVVGLFWAIWYMVSEGVIDAEDFEFGDMPS